MEQLSNTYIDHQGLLRCGESSKESSKVGGVKIEYQHNKDCTGFTYRLLFTTIEGYMCQGYRFSCNPSYWIDKERLWV